jgi:dienelactone hydrolase
MNGTVPLDGQERPVAIRLDSATLEGTLGVPERARGVVLFAHGSGSSRFSPRSRYVAGALRKAGLATLLLDLLTGAEEEVDQLTQHLRFDIDLLANRLVVATDWLAQDPATRDLRIGYFGASTGAGAALVAAAERPEVVGAVVSRGGRPDLAGPTLSRVQAPTLLIVGGDDVPVIRLNREALKELGAAESQLVIVPGATHLFEEPGALEARRALVGTLRGRSARWATSRWGSRPAHVLGVLKERGLYYRRGASRGRLCGTPKRNCIPRFRRQRRRVDGNQDVLDRPVDPAGRPR